MDERGNKRSMDLITCLQKFISEFDEQKPKMTEIISDLNKIFEQTKERKEGLGKKAATAGAITAGAGGVGGWLLATVLSPVTGGLSLVAAGASAAVVGAAAALSAVVVKDENSDKLTLDKVKELVLSFCGLADQLKNIEKEKKETTVQRLLEVKEKCELILIELDEMRTFYKIKMTEEQEQQAPIPSSLPPGRCNDEGASRENVLACSVKIGDWNMDLGQRLTFPAEIEATNLRPDLVLWSLRRVYITELTVPWEDSVDESYKQNSLKYSELAAEVESSSLPSRGLQSEVKMEEKGNRKSMDLIIFFQEFISEFDKQKPKIISELNEIFEQTKKRKEGLDKKAATAGVVSAGFSGVGAAVLASVLAPFTGGLSLVVAGASAAAVGAAAAVTGVVVKDEISDKRTLDKVMELVLSFCGMAEQLKNIEKEKSEMLEKPNLKPEAVIVLFTLIDQLDSLYLLFTEETTVQRLLEVKEKCELILIELEKMRTFYKIKMTEEQEQLDRDKLDTLLKEKEQLLSELEMLQEEPERSNTEEPERSHRDKLDRLSREVKQLECKLERQAPIPSSLPPGRCNDEGAVREHLGLLSETQDWNMDLGQRLTFPAEIAATNLRPDLVLWSLRRVYITELTVPWEDSVDEAYEQNSLKYSELAAEVESLSLPSREEHAQKEKCAQTGLKSQYLKNQSKQNQSQTKPEPGLKLV
ncbi:hypothetical protein WMY93_033475 [Mugilogobius chulae]|uniref:Uncharacterized protein n=1 Tax=Mugilogobius chulae TaxID=88201 RepID=A0AAW0MNJ9_9GOBI